MAGTLKDWKNQMVLVVTCDGRTIVGELAGHDQVQNLILKESQEFIYSLDQDVEKVPLGLYVIRGDNVMLISDFVADKLKEETRADPLKPILQQQI